MSNGMDWAMEAERMFPEPPLPVYLTLTRGLSDASRRLFCRISASSPKSSLSTDLGRLLPEPPLPEESIGDFAGRVSEVVEEEVLLVVVVD